MRLLLMLVLAAVAGCSSVDAEKTVTRADSDITTPPQEERPGAAPAHDTDTKDAPLLSRSDKPQLVPDIACPPEKPYVCPTPSELDFECRERACPPSCERVPCPNAFVCVDCGDGPACLPRDHSCN